MLSLILYILFALVAGAFILFGLGVVVQKSMSKDAEDRAKSDTDSDKPDNPEMQR